MTLVSRLAAVCYVLALPLLLVTTNVRVLISDVAFYERGMRAHDAAETTGIAQSELDRAAREIVDYFENDEQTLRIVVAENGQETSIFNARETQHMEDVKTLVRAVFRVHEITLAFVLIYIALVVLWSNERSFKDLARLTLFGVAAGFAMVAVVGAFAIAGFDETWNRFHELVFANDLWQLDPDTDRLIQMFPEPFWEEATYLVGVATLAEVTLLVALSALYLFRARGQTPAAAPAATRPEPAGEPSREEALRQARERREKERVGRE